MIGCTEGAKSFLEAVKSLCFDRYSFVYKNLPLLRTDNHSSYKVSLLSSCNDLIDKQMLQQSNNV